VFQPEIVQCQNIVQKTALMICLMATKKLNERTLFQSGFQDKPCQLMLGPELCVVFIKHDQPQWAAIVMGQNGMMDDRVFDVQWFGCLNGCGMAQHQPLNAACLRVVIWQKFQILAQRLPSVFRVKL
jgi:hypothetical protein